MRYLVTGKQAAEIDRHTIEEAGVPQLVLMERAALAVAEEVSAVVRDRIHDRILIAVEGGNNGGDGVAAARILQQRGYSVVVWTLNGIARQSEAYRKQIGLAEKAGVRFTDHVEDGDWRVVVDAIFGVGLTREVAGVQKEAVDRINEMRAEDPGMTVISVDIPSGISSETGEILGTAVRADRTVTFGYEKVGMRFAKNACGAVTIAEIGFFLPEGYEASAGLYSGYEPEDVRRLLPGRSMDGNKGSYGRVLVIAGSVDMSGAAYLAAEAAYRTGCGLVKVVTHESNRAALQQLLPEAILQCYTGYPGEQSGGSVDSLPLTEETLRWGDVIIIGPGIGQSETAFRLTEQVLRLAACPVIADADAINLLSEHTELLEETAGKRPLILTPHMLEMTRLAERSRHPEREALHRLRKNRTGITEQLAAKYQATIVLKDACTFVTEGNAAGLPGYLNTSGNDAMAKGGSGDVLTGVIGGLMAQGMRASEAARLGVYLHGRAGDRAREALGAYSVIAGDLLKYLF